MSTALTAFCKSVLALDKSLDTVVSCCLASLADVLAAFAVVVVAVKSALTLLKSDFKLLTAVFACSATPAVA